MSSMRKNRKKKNKEMTESLESRLEQALLDLEAEDQTEALEDTPTELLSEALSEAMPKEETEVLDALAELDEPDIRETATDFEETEVLNAATDFEETEALRASRSLDETEILEAVRELDETEILDGTNAFEKEKVLEEIAVLDETELLSEGQDAVLAARGEDAEPLDDLIFISHESVRDKSRMAEGVVIEDKHVSKKKTKRRSVDAEAAKKEKVQKVARTNLHFIGIGFLVFIVLIGLITLGVRQFMTKKAAANKEQALSVQEYEKNGYEEINALISSYYDCYAAGDTETILKYAYPMSDAEQSYIQMYSAFVEEYDNIVCYTKTGLGEDEYIVSVAFDVKYVDADTAAPGMDFFYVRTSESGSVYIDNTYSPFNLLYQEYSLNQEILQLIQTYEESGDVISLQAAVQTQYEQALAADETLASLVDGALAEAVAAWQADYEETLALKAEEAAKQVEAENAAEAAAAEEAEAEEAEEEVTETEEKAWVYVTDSVKIRKEPSEDATVLASVTAGSQVRQLAVRSDGWTRIKTGDIEGYIKTEYISGSASSTASSSLSSGKTIRLTSSVNIRSGMSETSDRIGLAYAGESVTVVESYSEGWTKVTWNGKTGYIRTDVLQSQ